VLYIPQNLYQNEDTILKISLVPLFQRVGQGDKEGLTSRGNMVSSPRRIQYYGLGEANSY